MTRAASVTVSRPPSGGRTGFDSQGGAPSPPGNAHPFPGGSGHTRRVPLSPFDTRRHQAGLRRVPGPPFGRGGHARRRSRQRLSPGGRRGARRLPGPLPPLARGRFAGHSESRVLGVILRALRKNTGVKFVVTYADPAQGHEGIIYRAANFLYTGLSEAMPLYDVGDGKSRHSRSLSHAYGTHSVWHFNAHGVRVRVISQAPKHRYLYLLNPSLHDRIAVPLLPYPKKESSDAGR